MWDINFDYCWNICKNSVENLKEYTLYAIKNIIQIRKSQQDAKLDWDLENIVKNSIIETDIFVDGENNAYDMEKDIEEEDGKNLDLSAIDLYTYIATMTYMHLKEKFVIDYI